MAWKASRYNLLVPVEGGGGVLYNAFTGACLDLGDEEFRRVSALLNSSVVDFNSLGVRPVQLGGALLAGGFIVDSALDELTTLRDRALEAQDGGPLTLTINPTFACNLDCGYCFVGKKMGNMRPETEREVVKFVEGYFNLYRDIPGLEVDWFGGEPLMGRSAIEHLSKAFLHMCASNGVYYSAQVITNGTLLTPELAEWLHSCGVDRLQITVDGTEATHNERRPWKRPVPCGANPVETVRAPARSSFQDTLRGIEVALGRFAIRCRINVDRRNLDQCMALLSMFEARGWLRPEARFYPYPSFVRDYTEAASVNWSIKEDCGMQAFYDLHRRWLDALNDRGVAVVKESLYGFPEPKATPCGAVSSRGWIINEDGSVHKCGFDTDNDKLSVGMLGQVLDPENGNLKLWMGYDCFADPQCRECRALPLCLGGCARDRREKRQQAMTDICEYRLKYEPQVLAQHIHLMRKNRGSPS